MAMDTEQKRRAALTFGRTVPMMLPKVSAVPVLGAIDRAMMLGCWAPSLLEYSITTGWQVTSRTSVWQATFGTQVFSVKRGV